MRAKNSGRRPPILFGRDVFVPESAVRRNRIRFLGLTLVLGVGLYEMRRFAIGRAETARLHAEAAGLETEAEKLRSARDRAQGDLAVAERQLAEIPVTPRPAGASAREAAMEGWFTRLKRLRKNFTDHPELALPEMALLTDADWLLAAKTARLDSEADIRTAMAQIRQTAKSRFWPKLGEAFLRHPTARTSTAPMDIFALAPFFNPPADPAMLGRYEMVLAPKVGAKSVDDLALGVLERTAVDPAYDMRIWLVDGFPAILDGPAAWVPDVMVRTKRAQISYKSANPGSEPPSWVTAKLLPYFDPPLPKDVAERIIAAENARSR